MANHVKLPAWLPLVIGVLLGARASASTPVHIVHSQALFGCLSSSARSDAAELALRDCEASDTASRWYAPAVEGEPGSLELLNDTEQGSTCLAVLDPNESTSGLWETQLVACDQTEQNWTWDARLRLVASGSGLCLGRNSTEAPWGLPELSDCTYSKEQQWLPFPTDTAAALAQIQLPLRAEGRFLVDAEGNRVKLTGPNWVGAHMEQRVNTGLDFLPAGELARLVRRMGFTHVRLNYAVQMLHDTEPVPLRLVAANPELADRTPLQIFDACVEALTAEGLLVVINAHTSDYRWCCSLTDEQGLWYNSRWSEKDWLDSLTSLARRYRSNSRVIGYDLRNEPRPAWIDGSTDPTLVWWDIAATWDHCSTLSVSVGHDLRFDVGTFSARGICLQKHAANLRAASHQGALAVWHGAPEAIAFIEGAAAADLQTVLKQPLPFKQACLHSRVVWSVHDYSWAWRWFDLFELLHQGAGSFSEIYQRMARIYEKDEPPIGEVLNIRRKGWGFLAEQNLAPVWVGEFGDASPDAPWFVSFREYAKEFDLDWAYWQLGGYKYPPGTHVHDGGRYMDSSQRLNIPGGVTQSYLEEGYGLLNVAHNAAQDPRKLYELLVLVPATLGPGISTNTSKDSSSTCNFDAERQPVTGTGPLPRGFAGYAHVSRSERCTGKGERRLLNKPAAGPAQEGLVEAGDKDLAERLQQERLGRCRRGARATAVVEASMEATDLLVEAQTRDGNAVDFALRSPNPQEMQRRFQEHTDSMGVEFYKHIWLAFLLLGTLVLVATLYFVQTCPLFRSWAPFPSPRLRRLASRTCATCSEVLFVANVYCPQTCSVFRSWWSTLAGWAFALCSRAFAAATRLCVQTHSVLRRLASRACAVCPGTHSALSKVVPLRLPAAANTSSEAGQTKCAKSIQQESVERQWAPSLVLSAIVLALIFGFFGRNIHGRGRFSAGVTVLSCSLASFMDEALSGSPDRFVGFLPALERVGAFVDDLEGPVGIGRTLETFVAEMKSLSEADQKLSTSLDSLQVLVTEENAACALGPDLERLTRGAQMRLRDSLSRQYRDAGARINDVLSGSSLDVLVNHMKSFLIPMQHVKRLVVGQFDMLYESDRSKALQDTVNMALHATWGLVLLVLPVSIVGLLAFIELLRNLVCGVDRDMRTFRCLRPYSERAHSFACLTWALSFIYAGMALVIAILLGTVVHEGSGFCATAAQVLDTGLDGYMDGLGIPEEANIRAYSSQLFETCFTRKGSGAILDTISFDGCTAGSSAASPATLRKRFDQVQTTLDGWFRSLDIAVRNELLTRTGEVRSLLSALEELSRVPLVIDEADNETVCGSGTPFWCHALLDSNSTVPGQCGAEEFRNLTAAFKPVLQAAFERLDIAVVNITNGAIAQVSSALQRKVISTVLELSGQLDCKGLGEHLQGVVDATCSGLLLGLHEISIAQYGLAACCLVLAVLQYLFWRHYRSASDLCDVDANQASPPPGLPSVPAQSDSDEEVFTL